jgi:uncharacterized protein DUF4349
MAADAVAPNAAQMPPPAAQKQEGGAATPQQQQQDSAPVQNRQLVQTARIELAVEGDPMGAVSTARGVATALNGFTGQEESGGDKASITLRIPADKFDIAIEQLTKLGRPTAQHKQADDVTEQVVDLDSRLATQRASVDRMRALLAKAQSVSEVAQIESELTRRESDLESMQGRRTALGGQVALSTVVLQVTKETPPAQKPVEDKATGGFLGGLGDGWGAFGTFINAIAVTVGTLLPFLVALGIPAGLYLYFRRKRRKAVPAVTP